MGRCQSGHTMVKLGARRFPITSRIDMVDAVDPENQGRGNERWKRAQTMHVGQVSRRDVGTPPDPRGGCQAPA